MNKPNPGLKFFYEEQGVFVQAPKDITGIHLLSKFLLNKFVIDRGYKASNTGKLAFLESVINSEVNKEFTKEDAIAPLSVAILASFDIRKKTEDFTLNSRDKKHVEYGIKKELENIIKENN